MMSAVVVVSGVTPDAAVLTENREEHGYPARQREPQIAGWGWLQWE